MMRMNLMAGAVALALGSALEVAAHGPSRKGPKPNKYEKPHQGKRERARRMRQLANTAKKQAA